MNAASARLIGIAASVSLALGACATSSPDAAQSPSSKSISPTWATPSPVPSIPSPTPTPQPAATDVIFDLLPMKADAETWGLPTLYDWEWDELGGSVNGVGDWSDASDPLVKFSGNGHWTKVKPAVCRPFHAFAYPPLDAEMEAFGVAGFESRGEKRAFVAVSIFAWPDEDAAHQQLVDAVKVADKCREYSVMVVDTVQTVTRYDKGTLMKTDHSLISTWGPTGSVAGQVGKFTYSLALAAPNAAKAAQVAKNADAWLASKISGS